MLYMAKAVVSVPKNIDVYVEAENESEAYRLAEKKIIDTNEDGVDSISVVEVNPVYGNSVFAVLIEGKQGTITGVGTIEVCAPSGDEAEKIALEAFESHGWTDLNVMNSGFVRGLTSDEMMKKIHTEECVETGVSKMPRNVSEYTHMKEV